MMKYILMVLTLLLATNVSFAKEEFKYTGKSVFKSKSSEAKAHACLSLGTFLEAGGDPYRSRHLTGMSILNRAAHKQFSEHPCDVLMEKQQFEVVTTRVKDVIKEIKKGNLSAGRKYVEKRFAESKLDRKRYYLVERESYELMYADRDDKDWVPVLCFYAPEILKARNQAVPRWVDKMYVVEKVGGHIYLADEPYVQETMIAKSATSSRGDIQKVSYKGTVIRYKYPESKKLML